MSHPKGERVWTSYHDVFGKLRFIITSKPARDFYLLYEAIDETFQKLGKAKSPTELEEKYEVNDRIRR